MEAKGLTKVQLELLKTLPYLKTDEEVMELKDAIADFFAKKVQEEMDRLWESGEWNMEKLESLQNQHFRTPYK